MENILKRILCIDDDNDILLIEKLALESIGNFEVFVCNDSRVALSRIEKVMPDLILLDVMMPEIDGIEIRKSLKNSVKLCHIPIIFMTAKIQPSEVAMYKTMDVAGVIQKPFDPMMLSQEIVKLWDNFLSSRQQKKLSSHSIDKIRLAYLSQLKEQHLIFSKLLLSCRSGSLHEVEWHDLQQRAHKLKGSGGTYGFTRISHAAQVLENILETNDLHKISLALENLLQTLSEAENQIDATGAATQTIELPEILIVGESRTVINSITDSLREEAFTIAVNSVEEAETVLNKKSIHLIIIGERVTSVLALAFLRKVTTDLATHHIPVIILTHSSALEEILPFITLGAADFIVKPLNQAVLIEKIRNKLKWQQTTVMIVDDDPAIREILGHKFKTAGFNVLLAADGQEALELTEKQKPQLVILDLMMPGLDGIALLQKLRMRPEFKEMPALFLSAKRQEEDILEAFKLGAQDYIIKPFIPEEVIARSLRLLEKK